MFRTKREARDMNSKRLSSTSTALRTLRFVLNINDYVICN